MKHNIKETVNIVALVEEYVQQLNDSCEGHDLKEMYKLTISDTGKKKGKGKTLRLMHYDLQTNERIVLYSTTHTFKNPGESLTVDYKRKLCKQFMYDSFTVFAITIKSNMAKAKADRLLKAKARQQQEEVNDINVNDFAVIKGNDEA